MFHRAYRLGFDFALQVIAINDKFPGPTINVTTNNNVVVNVRNKLDESLLMHWYDLLDIVRRGGKKKDLILLLF